MESHFENVVNRAPDAHFGSAGPGSFAFTVLESTQRRRRHSKIQGLGSVDLQPKQPGDPQPTVCGPVPGRGRTLSVTCAKAWTPDIEMPTAG